MRAGRRARRDTIVIATCAGFKPGSDNATEVDRSLTTRVRGITHRGDGVDDPTEDAAPDVLSRLPSNRLSVCATIGVLLSDPTSST